MKKILLFVFGIFLFLSLVSAFDLSNVFLDQQNLVCSDLNFSYVDCYDFWTYLNNYENVTNLSCDFSNYTLSSECITNQTQLNCSNDLNELQKIDEYLKRGFEPVFEGGFIVNFKKVENVSQDCSAECSQAVEQIKAQYSAPVVSQQSDSDKQNTLFFIIVIVLILCVVGYFGIKRLMNKNISSPPQDSNLSSAWVDFLKPKQVNNKQAKSDSGDLKDSPNDKNGEF